MENRDKRSGQILEVTNDREADFPSYPPGGTTLGLLTHDCGLCHISDIQNYRAK